ncbi:hypothetical protein PG990_003537 [Apiospora arundinis]
MPMPTSQLTQQPNDALDASHDHAVNSEALEKNVELERELSSAQNSSILPGHGLPHEDAMLSPRMQSLAPTDAPEWTPGSEDANNTDGLHLRGGGPSAGKGQETPLSNPETNDMPEGNASVADALPSLVDEAKKRKAKEVSIATGSPEVIDSQSIINQYRERLARDLERREQLARSPHLAHLNEKRPSPIREEMSFSSVTASTSSSDLPTASTESNKTVRGGSTPCLHAWAGSSDTVLSVSQDGNA